MKKILTLKELGLLSIIEKVGGEITKQDLYEITVPTRSGRAAYTTALRALVAAGAVKQSKQHHINGRFASQTLTLTADH
jgi:hypothetical protein